MKRLGPSLVLLMVLVACSGPQVPSARSPSDSPDSSPSAAPASASATAEGSEGWVVEDDAPFARLEMATAAHGGRIWMAGGLSPLGDALTDVDVFDPASGEWSDGPSLPTGIHHAALVSDGERLIFIGGYIGPDFNRITDIVLVLADGDDEWVGGPSMPGPRAAGGAAFDGTRVVYAGGFSPNDIESDVFALEGDEWVRIGVMAKARDHLAAASDGDGTVWLMGGRVGGLSSNLADVEIVTSQSVQQVTQLPTRRGGVAAFYAETLGACLTGGESPDAAHTTVECVDADGAVTILPPLNVPHHGHGAAVVGGIAYVLLGGPEPALSASSTVESLALER